jgi:hypothetical protein
MHVAPVCTGSNHFVSYVQPFPTFLQEAGQIPLTGLEPMTSWSQGDSFTAAPGLPFWYIMNILKIITQQGIEVLTELSEILEGFRLLLTEIFTRSY